MNDEIWNFSAGALAILFLAHVTARGQLPEYIKLLIYTPPPSSTTQQGAAAPDTVFNRQTGPGAVAPNTNPKQQGFELPGGLGGLLRRFFQ